MKLLLILFVIPLLYSFKFTPMSQSIELGGENTNAQFLLENDSSQPMAIELTVKERQMDVSGKEDLPSTSEIAIFPPQMIIPAKEKRTVRVSWKGSKSLPSEKAFRVIAEQLPLNVDEKAKKQSGIQMLMRYMAALYITPPDAEAKLKATLRETNPKSITVEIKNAGTKHKILLSPVLTLSHGGKTWKLKGPDLKVMDGENVLAQGERRFEIPVKETIPAGAEVSLKVNN